MSTQQSSSDPILDVPTQTIHLEDLAEGLDQNAYLTEKLYSWYQAQQEPGARREHPELSKADVKQLVLQHSTEVNKDRPNMSQITTDMNRQDLIDLLLELGDEAEITADLQEKIKSMTVLQLAELVITFEDQTSLFARDGAALYAGEEFDTAASGFLYLSKAAYGHQAGTLVYRKRSNLATEYRLIGNVLKHSGGVSDLRPLRHITMLRREQEDAAAQLQNKSSSLPWDMNCTEGFQPPHDLLGDTDAALKFAQVGLSLLGLLPGGGVATTAGSFLIDLYWPKGDDTKWDKVFAAVENFEKETTVKAAITLAKNKLRTVIDLIHDSYLPLKRRPDTDTNKLYSDVQVYVGLIAESIELMRKPNTIQYGLEPFAYAANLMLVVRQESAYLESKDAPKDSAAAETMSTEAKEFSDLMYATVELMVKERMSCISDALPHTETTQHFAGHGSASSTTTKTTGYYYTDAFLRHRSEISYFKKQKERDDTRRLVEREVADYRRRAESNYRDSLAELSSMGANWAKLAKNPISLTTQGTD